MLINWTHKQLVKIAYRWVLKNTSCGVAFREMSCYGTNEEPDVLGIGSHGHSVLVEVKVTRSDFLADKKKSFRKNPEEGMGSQRFYLCPTGLIKVSELPEGWGLVYVNDKGKATAVHKPYTGNIGERHGENKFEKNLKAEHAMMYSALRRLHLRGRIEEIYEEMDLKRHQENKMWEDHQKWLEEEREKNRNIYGDQELQMDFDSGESGLHKTGS